MRRLRLGLAACVLLLAVWAATASADPNGGPPICNSAGTALAGNYHDLTVSGDAHVAAGTTLNVSGTLRIAPGACFDAFTLGTVHVGGNLLVGQGAILALGCTPNALGDPTAPPCFDRSTNDTVDGNLVANRPLTMYLDGNTIRGSLMSFGGGGGRNGPFLNFPIKDNTIGGNLIVIGWRGGWFGAIRNQIGGSALISGNASVVSETGPGVDSDSTEVQTNTISGNLACFFNTPPAQVNPADGGQPNVVGGHKLGECAGL